MGYKLKKLFILLPLSMVMMCTSCNHINNRDLQLTELTNEEGKKIQTMSKEIIRCFTEHDKEALKKLFCEQVRNQPDFDKEIDKAFEYFPCEVYIKSEINKTAGGDEHWESGRRTNWYVSPNIPYIKILVDKDKDPSTMPEPCFYSMCYNWQIIRDEDKSLEGLQYIRIELLNIDSIELGKQTNDLLLHKQN